jgi:hypothetical protein
MSAVTELLVMYRDQVEDDPAAAAALGFTGPKEMQELWLLRPSLTVAAARWQWQCGESRAACESCSNASSGLVNMMAQLGGAHPGPLFAEVYSPRVQAGMKRAGLLPTSVEPCQELGDFLRGARRDQKPGGGFELVGKAYDASEEEGYQAGITMFMEAGNKEEQRLYVQFETWLDQLVSQVTGRGVALVIEPKVAHLCTSRHAGRACQVYLKDAASGEQLLFGWQQPGDVDRAATYEQLVLAAKQRGVSDPDLLQYCAGVEPYEGVPADSASSSSSSSDGAASGKPCAHCGQHFSKLVMCARCRGVAYCHKKCQSAHWKAGHKQVCKEQAA